MKKTLKIILIFLLVVFVLLLVTPMFFKKPIKNFVNEQINKSVNAKVDFDISVSMLRSFPNLYIGLTDVKVIGTGDFEKDTLVAFKTFSVSLDLMSALHKNIQVKSVFLDSPHLTAHVLPNGKANWNIMKDTTTSKAVDTTKSSPIDFKASLKKFEIVHAYITYKDDNAKMSAAIKDLYFFLSGDFSAKQSDLTIKTTIESLDFIMGGMRYLKQAKIGFAATVGANLEKAVYTIKDNVFSLNDISLSVNGSIAMLGKDIKMDLTYKTNKADFKTILSLVPAIYLKDFPGVKATGNIVLNGYAKGIYNDKRMPDVGATLKIQNGMFKYPGLPKDVHNINMDMKMFYDGAKMDNTTVDVNTFHVELAGNPIDMSLHIKTPISDMDIKGNLKGKIDFGSIRDVIPMDSMSIKGLLTCNVDMAGKMSSIQKSKYEDFKADGTMELSNFEFISKDFPQGVKIVKTLLTFSPKYVDLTSFDCRIGKSDIQLSGKLEKFIPYYFIKDTLKGNLIFSSTLLDINELMGPPAKTVKPEVKDTTPLNLAIVPGNINFVLSTKIAKINYDKLVISAVSGEIAVRNSKANLKNLTMNMLQGNVVMNGEYNTKDIKKPFFDFKFNMKDIDIPSTYTAFNTVKKLAPIAENCKGKISADLAIKSDIDQHMMPLYPTMNGNGRLQSKDIELSNNKAFDKIAEVLKNDKFKKFSLSNVDLKFEIKNGRIFVTPFDTKMGNAKLNIGGDQGLDQTLNYLIKAAIPRTDLGGAANSAITGLASAASAKGLKIQPGENVNVDIAVVGTFTKPQVKLNMKESAKNAAEDLKNQVKTVVTEKAKEVVTKNVKEQADKIIKDAEGEAQKIRDAAKVSADATRKGANSGADEVLKQATNPFTKIAAQKTAEKIRKEGDVKANKITEEGNGKADQVINKAKDEASKLK